MRLYPKPSRSSKQQDYVTLVNRFVTFIPASFDHRGGCFFLPVYFRLGSISQSPQWGSGNSHIFFTKEDTSVMAAFLRSLNEDYE